MRALAGARTRILLTFVVLMAGSLLISTLAIRQVLNARAGERVDDALEQESAEFRDLAADGRDPQTGEPFGDDLARVFEVFLNRNIPSEGESFFTYLDGRPFAQRFSAGNRSRPRLTEGIDRLATATTTRRGEIETRRGLVRYLAVPVLIGERGRGVFVVTEDLGGELREVEEAVRVTAGVSVVVLLLASGLAFVLAGRVLAPLRDLRETATSITESDLTRRIPAEGRDEIADLARTFNAMLDRLEKAFSSQRELLSDAGHELRTPITIVRGHLELLGDDPAERREVVALVTDELDRMARLVDDLMLLARAERPDFLQPGEIDLDELTEELLAKAQALGPRDWRLDGLGTGRITADRQRLTQAVMELARNAVRHTAEGDEIGLGSRLDGARAELWVRDTGPGVPPEERERVFGRFVRGSERAGEGHGLGLSIVRAIAEGHGGRIAVDDPPGATFTIHLPREDPA